MKFIVGIGHVKEEQVNGVSSQSSIINGRHCFVNTPWSTCKKCVCRNDAASRTAQLCEDWWPYFSENMYRPLQIFLFGNKKLLPNKDHIRVCNLFICADLYLIFVTFLPNKTYTSQLPVYGIYKWTKLEVLEKRKLNFDPVTICFRMKEQKIFSNPKLWFIFYISSRKYVGVIILMSRTQWIFWKYKLAHGNGTREFRQIIRGFNSSLYVKHGTNYHAKNIYFITIIFFRP